MGTEGIKLALPDNLDKTKAVCHEIVAKGDDCQNVHLMVGQHCLHLSTAADAADYDKFETKQAVYLFVHEDDVIASWWKEDAVTAVQSIPGNEKTGQ